MFAIAETKAAKAVSEKLINAAKTSLVYLKSNLDGSVQQIRDAKPFQPATYLLNKLKGASDRFELHWQASTTAAKKAAIDESIRDVNSRIWIPTTGEYFDLHDPNVDPRWADPDRVIQRLAEADNTRRLFSGASSLYKYSRYKPYTAYNKSQRMPFRRSGYRPYRRFRARRRFGRRPRGRYVSRRRRYSNRRSGGLARFMNGGLITRASTSKQYDIYAVPFEYLVNTVYNHVMNSTIERGVGLQFRQTEHLMAKKLLMRFLFSTSSSIVAINSAAYWIRIWVIYDKQTNGAAATFASDVLEPSPDAHILNGGSATDPEVVLRFNNADNTSRFLVLYDKRFVLSMGTSMTMFLNETVNLRSLVTKYDQTTGAITIANIRAGTFTVNFYIGTNDAAVNTTLRGRINYRFKFSDV